MNMLKPTPLFTFKHYAAVIRILRAARPSPSHLLQWLQDVNALADMFAADNPKFKRDLFITECNEQVTHHARENRNGQ